MKTARRLSVELGIGFTWHLAGVIDRSPNFFCPRQMRSLRARDVTMLIARKECFAFNTFKYVHLLVKAGNGIRGACATSQVPKACYVELTLAITESEAM